MTVTDGTDTAGQVGFVFDDVTEFYAMRSYIDLLWGAGIATDVIVQPNPGYRTDELYRYTTEIIEGLGYLARSADPAVHYKILFAPYADIIQGTDYEYLIKYNYSTGVFSKPNPGDGPAWALPFDAELCFCELNLGKRAYTQQLPVALLQYKDFARVERTEAKPRLVYLPTFGPSSSIDEIGPVLDLLRERYYLIVKAHHATQFHPEEAGRVRLLRQRADEYHDQDCSIIDLLARADVVLSDNSGAIFDAIYTRTPVAVLSKDLNISRLPGIDTTQQALAACGLLPWASNPDEVLEALDYALAHPENIAVMRDDVLGMHELTDHSQAEFVQLVEGFLASSRVDDRYYACHDLLRDGFFEAEEHVRSLSAQLAAANERVSSARLEADRLRAGFEGSVSWRLTRPLRGLSRVLRVLRTWLTAVLANRG